MLLDEPGLSLHGRASGPAPIRRGGTKAQPSGHLHYALSLHESRSPLTHETASALPVMIAIAEFENPLLDLYGLELAYRIAVARRRSSRFHVCSVGRKRLAPVQTLRADWRNLLGLAIGQVVGSAC
ncbi:hypothetical protein NKH10_00125 [Mesorhizobium sp. M1340]|uniref:hypothetical protein n=1 Tax=unclassified Mesorhizobium TaxID=325217 RepID=UPI00333AA666